MISKAKNTLVKQSSLYRWDFSKTDHMTCQVIRRDVPLLKGSFDSSVLKVNDISL